MCYVSHVHKTSQNDVPLSKNDSSVCKNYVLNPERKKYEVGFVIVVGIFF